MPRDCQLFSNICSSVSATEPLVFSWAQNHLKGRLYFLGSLNHRHDHMYKFFHGI
jgi:hypothetical protein